MFLHALQSIWFGFRSAETQNYDTEAGLLQEQ